MATEARVVRPAKVSTWSRRRATMAGHWATFRASRRGMVGLSILVFFTVVAVASPLLVSEAEVSPALATGPLHAPPQVGYPLGTDNFGRSVLDLLIVGARVSLLVGVTAAIGAMLIGAIVGISAGYFGGTRIDAGLNALTNWFLVIPWLALAIALATVLGASLTNVIVVIAITSWAATARLVRAQALTVKERSYIERSRAIGGSHWHVVTRHVLPNVFPVLFANTILMVALAILSETTLAILGLSDPVAISWGKVIESAFTAGAMTAGYWWWLIPPGICIVLVTLAFTMVGFALDEILSPRLRQR
ncbi:MAG TPA: ABC transporter permease [Actinomycetota bacterium]|nr:ABC transporter permease [Actinomycetota bacterium]